MPYRNVYEEKNQRISRGSKEEPEKDPRKIAQIYKSQMPTKADAANTAEKLINERERIERAKTADRGIKKSILGKSPNRSR